MRQERRQPGRPRSRCPRARPAAVLRGALHATLSLPARPRQASDGSRSEARAPHSGARPRPGHLLGLARSPAPPKRRCSRPPQRPPPARRRRARYPLRVQDHPRSRGEEPRRHRRRPPWSPPPRQSLPPRKPPRLQQWPPARARAPPCHCCGRGRPRSDPPRPLRCRRLPRRAHRACPLRRCARRSCPRPAPGGSTPRQSGRRRAPRTPATPPCRPRTAPHRVRFLGRPGDQERSHSRDQPGERATSRRRAAGVRRALPPCSVPASLQARPLRSRTLPLHRPDGPA